MSCDMCLDRQDGRTPGGNFSLCAACYTGVRTLISLIPKNLNDGDCGDNDDNSGDGNWPWSDSDDSSSSDKRYKSTSQVLADCLTWVKEIKDVEEYLGGFVDFFKQQIPTDIQILPGGNDGLPISAHKALLATRSNVFKNMLSSDEIMASRNDKITLHEFTYEELDCFVELIYKGQLTKEKVDKHLYAMAIASHKYGIPLLANFCERKLQKSLNTKNALEILEISHTCHMQKLKEFILDFILEDKSGIVSSPKFDEFALKNPHLSMEITRAFSTAMKRHDMWDPDMCVIM